MGILARRAIVMVCLLRSGREDVVLCLRIGVSGVLSEPHKHKEKSWGQFEGTEMPDICMFGTFQTSESDLLMIGSGQELSEA